jgi:hypothetical protein
MAKSRPEENNLPFPGEEIKGFFTLFLRGRPVEGVRNQAGRCKGKYSKEYELAQILASLILNDHKLSRI